MERREPLAEKDQNLMQNWESQTSMNNINKSPDLGTIGDQKILSKDLE